jgi:hypothetical protein
MDPVPGGILPFALLLRGHLASALRGTPDSAAHFLPGCVVLMLFFRMHLIDRHVGIFMPDRVKKGFIILKNGFRDRDPKRRGGRPGRPGIRGPETAELFSGPFGDRNHDIR